MDCSHFSSGFLAVSAVRFEVMRFEVLQEVVRCMDVQELITNVWLHVYHARGDLILNLLSLSPWPSLPLPHSLPASSIAWPPPCPPPPLGWPASPKLSSRSGKRDFFPNLGPNPAARTSLKMVKKAMWN